ncbi:MAG: helix-turn-helix transcriptional regulator [Cyanobacteria bacterium P01_A01_bin.17]
MGKSVYSTRYKRFLALLKQAKLDAGLTQMEVAKYLNQPQSYVSKCESGERRVDIVELLNFAEVYQRQIQDFVQMANEAENVE